MAKDKLRAYSASASSHSMCSKLCNKFPFPAFTTPLYLGFRDGWPDLANGISGVWVLGPKPRFQNQNEWVYCVKQEAKFKILDWGWIEDL
jgi:hypothetical protein